MEASQIYEIIGYAASLLVAVSLMMRSILRLRLLNLVGAIFFTIYGLLIRAYPVAAVNAFIVLINIYYLAQIFNVREYFTLLEVRPDSNYLKQFLTFYEREIQQFWPGFTPDYAPQNEVIFVLRNMVPAGVFIGEKTSGKTLNVKLDFVIPGYRDFKIGRYVFVGNAHYFREKGYERISSPPGSQIHSRYLTRMGFRPEVEQDRETLYYLDVNGMGSSTEGK